MSPGDGKMSTGSAAPSTRIDVSELSPYELFVAQHRNQLETSVVPSHLWNSLFLKLSQNVFDAGSAFSLMQVEDEDGEFQAWKAVVIKEDGIKENSEESIYLIDHAWTFRPEMAKQHLTQHPGLLERMCNLMDIPTMDDSSGDNSSQIEKVMSEKWKFAQTYWVGNVASAEDRVPVWYILDEFGSRVQHSFPDYNVRVVPFVSLLDGAAYSLLFPVRDLEANEEITRDYLEGPEATDPKVRKCLMNTWEDVDCTALSWALKEPSTEFFMTSRENETLPNLEIPLLPLPTDRKIRVYAEYDVIRKNLNDSRFEIVETPVDADILWLMVHYKDFKGFSEEHPGRRINQFPFENVFTIKDLLSVICRRKKEAQNENANLVSEPRWLPTTFNMKTELPEFVSYFQNREKEGLDNHWILKPWNLARALDTHISSDLHHILRLPSSGPKIAQKYIENPVYFNRPGIGKVKFDIRYILLLKSVRPLKVYAYNRFWLRFANQPFELKDLDVYEKHFTVMNYSEESDLKQMFCQDFIKDFESQYPEVSWKSVEKSIFKMFKDVFSASESEQPPAGIATCPQAGAMYASDLMLSWEDSKTGLSVNPDDDGGNKSGNLVMQPKILEINWGPDCERACDYYPEFFDNVFSTLFLDEPEGQNVTLL